MNIPPSHPRFASLLLREKITEGVRCGIVHETGLIAHGRGEAFDYLLGETTIPVAKNAARAAAYILATADAPVISVNGNTAVLAGRDIVKLAEVTRARIEVNLFHRTQQRIEAIVSLLTDIGAKNVLGKAANARIPGLGHDRAKCSREGIWRADVVLVPLEDGDRCLALKDMGKTVITIDLNPLSRTAQTADITVIDNIVRAIPLMTACAEQKEFLNSWNNEEGLRTAIQYINIRLKRLYQFKE